MKGSTDTRTPLGGIQPDRVVFWSGAGISSGSPSCLPLGDQLTREVVQACCLPGTWERMVELFASFDVRDTDGTRRTAPRLEAILDGCVQALGLRTLALLDGLGRAVPNPMHHFFGAHLDAGGKHLTVNLDDCIERTGCSARPTHLHGLYERDALDLLGARLAVVGRGLPASAQEAIIDGLRRAEALIVCGYGGRDFFDVDPFFRGHPAFGANPIDLGNLRVLWLSHEQTQEARDEPLVPGCPAVGRAMLEALERRGASVVIRRCDTELELGSLAAAWGERWPESSCSEQSSWREPFEGFRPSDRERRWTTATLWRAMSLGGDLASHELALEAQSREEWFDYQPRHRALEALYIGRAHTGRYKQAAATARTMRGRARFLAGIAEYRLAVAMRHSRRPLRAWIAHNRALRLTRSKGTEKPPQYYDVRLTYLSLHRDLRSRRFLRLLTADARAGRAFREVAEAGSYLSLHPHAVPQLRAAYAEIPALRTELMPSALQTADALAFYLQSDNFIGPINAARDHLHDRGRREIVMAPEFLSLAAQSRELGDLPGELKALLLARRLGGGDERPTFRQLPLRALQRIEWALLHKAIFVLRWSLPTYSGPFAKARE